MESAEQQPQSGGGGGGGGSSINSDLNPPEALVVHQVHEVTASNNDGGDNDNDDDDDDDVCCDEDDDDTIEFEIEVVSNDSSSKPGSLIDLRDEETREVDERESQLDSTSQSESPPDIVDIANLPSTIEASEAADEATTSAAYERTEQSSKSNCALDEVIDDALASQPDETATFIEIIYNDDISHSNELELELDEQQVEEEEAEHESNAESGRNDRVNDQQEGEKETIELEMKLKEENRSVEETSSGTTQIKNDDLREFSAQSEPTNEPTSQLSILESDHQLPAVRTPTVASQEKFLDAQPVGFRNIREIYKVLNSDSVLIVGCRPEIVVEPTATQRVDEQAVTVEVEEKERPEVVVDQEMTTVEVLEDEPQPVAATQSPEIKIEHSPRIAFPVIPDDRSCSGDESEDLEWEFDHEPPFEKRDVQVKRGKDPRAEYEFGGELGRGKFGTVLRCTHQESGRKLAAKFVITRRKEDREDVEREVEIMSLLQHKRLLQLFDAFDNGTNEMCLVMELVEGGELFERIVDDDFDLTEKKAAIFMRQICEGVEYMHSQNIVHLDMKPENILCISRTGNRIKLIDFGLARRLDPNETLRVMFGTPDFAAPEVLCYDTVSLATDMWSVGVICYVLLSGLSPFMGNNDMETMANVTRATYDFDEAAFDPITDLAKDFISKLLLRDQTKRLKPSECLQHPWLARGGVQLEAAVRERRKSIAVESQADQFSSTQISASDLARLNALVSSITVSLDKRNLKKYVVRRKWHKTVHAIMALGRMGAKLKARLVV